MGILQDWHIHTRNSCDEASLTVEDLLAGAAARGVRDFGITDHIHTLYNEPDIAASRAEYDEVISRHPELAGRFRFGVEASCVSRWEMDLIAQGGCAAPVYGIREGGPSGAEMALAVDEAMMQRYHIEFVVGGVHWPLYCPMDRESLLREYHRQYLFVVRHPQVDILAHWLWWLPRPGVPNPFEDFSAVPAFMKDELAQALLATGTVFELNLEAVLNAANLTDAFKDGYLAYAAELQRAGVRLCIGSDCHSPLYTDVDHESGPRRIRAAGIDLAKVGFTPR